MGFPHSPLGRLRASPASGSPLFPKVRSRLRRSYLQFWKNAKIFSFCDFGRGQNPPKFSPLRPRHSKAPVFFSSGHISAQLRVQSSVNPVCAQLRVNFPVGKPPKKSGSGEPPLGLAETKFPIPPRALWKGGCNPAGGQGVRRRPESTATRPPGCPPRRTATREASCVVAFNAQLRFRRNGTHFRWGVLRAIARQALKRVVCSVTQAW